MVQYWLMKSEPNVYSIHDLERDGSTLWDGVRNYEARNNMQAMKAGDRVLFYHSNAKPPGVAGTAVVCKEAYPDPTQFDSKNKYHDPNSPLDKPRWELVDIQFERAFDDVIGLPAIKANPAFEGMPLIAPFSRLSVQPVAKKHFNLIEKLGRGTS